VIQKAEEIKATKEEHIRVVLERQDQLWYHGSEDPKSIARVAQASSRFARERAHVVAVVIGSLSENDSIRGEHNEPLCFELLRMQFSLCHDTNE
jgi:hypothetical protein